MRVRTRRSGLRFTPKTTKPASAYRASAKPRAAGKTSRCQQTLAPLSHLFPPLRARHRTFGFCHAEPQADMDGAQRSPFKRLSGQRAKLLPDAACEVGIHRGCWRREESLSARQAV